MPPAVGLFALCWQHTDTAETSDASRLYLAGSVPLQEGVEGLFLFSTSKITQCKNRKEKKIIMKTVPGCQYIKLRSHFILKAIWEEILPLIWNKG